MMSDEELKELKEVLSKLADERLNAFKRDIAKATKLFVNGEDGKQMLSIYKEVMVPSFEDALVFLKKSIKDTEKEISKKEME